MQVGGKRKSYDDINITPMLDLAYVLLVIFILMATASVQGIKVDLPKASSAVSLAQPKTIAITVNNEGQIFMDAFPVTLPDLETRLRNAKASNPDVPIVLKGDATAQYGKITEVLDL
ncbi:MAG TPA: biopolymer transporter ExbD, partial [Sphingomonas sp.]|nr:biopolymer transporter ExbD [Sphingomonas sp.]